MTSTPLPASTAAPTRPAGRRSSGALVAHLGWEAVLLVAAVVLLVLVAGRLHGRSLLPLLSPQLALAGLPAVGLALSLRTGTVNLAVGAIAGEAGLLVALRVADGASLWGAAALVVGAALVAGAVVGALVGLSGVPSWAASLGLLALLTAVALQRGTNIIQLETSPGNLTATFHVLALVMIVGSLLGGVLWLLAPVRHALGGSPTGRVESLGGRVLRGTVGYAGSFALAALGGAASVLWVRAWSPSTSTDTLLISLAIVLLGGVSAYGGRGGVAGTALATVLLVAISFEIQLHGARYWVRLLLVGLAILVGLGIGVLFRALERELPAGTASYSGPAGPAGPVPPPGFAGHTGYPGQPGFPGQTGYLGQPGYPAQAGYPAPGYPPGGVSTPPGAVSAPPGGAPTYPASGPGSPVPGFTPPATAQPPVDQPGAPQYRPLQPATPQYRAPQPAAPQPAAPQPAAPQPAAPQHPDAAPLPTRTPALPPPAWPTPQGTNETDKTHRIDPSG